MEPVSIAGGRTKTHRNTDYKLLLGHGMCFNWIEYIKYNILSQY